MSDIIDELGWRGLIAVSTDLDDLRRALDTGIVTFKGTVRNAAGQALCEMVSPIIVQRRADVAAG